MTEEAWREIEARLTHRQREAIRKGHGSVAVCRHLEELGIADRVEGTGMNWLAFPIFSRLGIQIRCHLQAPTKEQH